MKRYVGSFNVLVLGLLLASACAPATPRGGDERSAGPGAGKTLVIMAGAELPSFAMTPLQDLPNPRATDAKFVVNANLVHMDERGLPKPFLAEALPQLDADSWRVLPDGSMETIYRLKPDLTWHDGHPLTAEDFVLSWRVYATPEFGLSERVGFRSIEEVLAPDPRAVLIRWKERYTEAAEITGVLPPLPRHILEQPFEERQGESFIALPFWSVEYVGAGPWKLERREPGAFFEAVAFDGFVFGRPRIDRVRVIYQPDSNTGVANLLSGEAHYSVGNLLHGEEGLTLERAWAANGGGKVLWETSIAKGQEIQMRPEFAVPTQLATDARVRQALAFLIDKETLTEVITVGKGLVREIYTHPYADFYDAVLRGVPTRYSYDARRAQQLLESAGFTRGGDGFWVTPTSERFTLEQWYLAGATNERDSIILIDTFRRFGIDASSNVFGIQRTSNEERVTTSGIFGGSLGNLPTKYHTKDVARPENRWRGANRFGFSNPQMDQVIDAYFTTLDRSERIRQIARMEQIAMEQLPAIPTYWTASVVAHAGSLKGVVPKLIPEGGTERGIWNWEWV